jgi:phosphoribosylanthranilate isomerase
MQPLIKICGITNLADALCAVQAGADALGFVFAPSPRQIAPRCARKIIDALPPGIAAVGLFVNAPVALVLECAEIAGVSALQLHGEEPPQDLARLARDYYPSRNGHPWPKIVKAFRPRTTADIVTLSTYPAAQAFLIDAYAPDKAGGTGQCADWAIAAEAKQFDRPVILAGGLQPDNVAAALAQVAPFAVDVSSGVESSPGKKDAAKIRDFIRLVRS